MTHPNPVLPVQDSPPTGRIAALDLARAGALAAMVLFHLVFDLELFGFVEQGTTMQPGWRWLAYLTAGSFLFLAGVSLWLAHGRAIRWRGFWRRFAMIAAAALMITGGTAIAMPDVFIFFGILHAIAASSLLGLLFLRGRVLALLAIGTAVLILPQMMRFPALDAPWFWWTGLQATPLRSLDYVPLFPWFAPVLFGLATAKLMTRNALWPRLEGWQAPAALAPLAWAGRNSLLLYLAHQPVLIGLVWAVRQLAT